MKTVKGRYNGSVVILEEPAPVDHEVAVQVEFPETEPIPEKPVKKRFHWIGPEDLKNLSPISAADEVIRQRRMD
jgi:hypothetical protein